MKGFVFLILLLLAASAAAETYYADVRVDVDAGGMAVITGTTNHPQLSPRKTDAYTSKRGGYWLLNITLPEGDVFSDYVFEVNLPEGASINYVRSSGQFRITTNDGKISVKGLGKKEGMSVIIQYQLKAKENADYTPYYAAAVLAVAGVAGLGYIIHRRRGEPDDEPLSYDPDMLTERQREIMRVLAEADKPINQAVICEKLKLPKSSVSRNVDSLARMGLVVKARTGMSTMLSLKK